MCWTSCGWEEPEKMQHPLMVGGLLSRSVEDGGKSDYREGKNGWGRNLSRGMSREGGGSWRFE